MKKRYGFVSNSSSSSFIIEKKDLSDFQIYQIKLFREALKKVGEDCRVEETESELILEEVYPFEAFLEYLNVST